MQYSRLGPTGTAAKADIGCAPIHITAAWAGRHSRPAVAATAAAAITGAGQESPEQAGPQGGSGRHHAHPRILQHTQQRTLSTQQGPLISTRPDAVHAARHLVDSCSQMGGDALAEAVEWVEAVLACSQAAAQPPGRRGVCRGDGPPAAAPAQGLATVREWCSLLRSLRAAHVLPGARLQLLLYSDIDPSQLGQHAGTGDAAALVAEVLSIPAAATPMTAPQQEEDASDVSHSSSSGDSVGLQERLQSHSQASTSTSTYEQMSTHTKKRGTQGLGLGGQEARQWHNSRGDAVHQAACLTHRRWLAEALVTVQPYLTSPQHPVSVLLHVMRALAVSRLRVPPLWLSGVCGQMLLPGYREGAAGQRANSWEGDGSPDDSSSSRSSDHSVSSGSSSLLECLPPQQLQQITWAVSRLVQRKTEGPPHAWLQVRMCGQLC